MIGLFQIEIPRKSTMLRTCRREKGEVRFTWLVYRLAFILISRTRIGFILISLYSYDGSRN